MEWYYAENNERMGPVDEEQFQELVAEGKIQPDTLVWKQGMANWQPYVEIADTASSEPDGVPVGAEPETEDTGMAGQSKCSQCGSMFPDEDLITYQNLLVCATCKPTFFQKVKEGMPVAAASPTDRYGSIEKGLAGDYDFKVSEILSEAWALTKGAKRHILGGTIIMYLIMFLLNGLSTAVSSQFTGSSFEVIIGIQFFFQILAMVITYPMTAGIVMMGINRSVEQPIRVSMLFNYFHKVLPLIGMYILQSIFIVIGFVLLVVPGIYLMFAYMLSLPLLVEKNFGVWRAMETSRKAVTRKWFKIFWLFFLMGLILTVSIIPLGIGLIWTIPLMSIAYGVLYRTVFGVDAPAAR